MHFPRLFLIFELSLLLNFGHTKSEIISWAFSKVVPKMDGPMYFLAPSRFELFI